MSLRSRLLVGMAVVALVLVGVAVVIARSTEAHLIDQVDTRLRSARTPGRAIFREPDGGPGGPRGPQAFYVAAVDRTGAMVVWDTPNVGGTTSPAPDLTADDIVEHAERGEPFTVGSRDDDLRYRMLAGRDRRSQVAAVVGLPLEDVDDAVQRLVAVEVGATVLIVAVLGLVTLWVIRLGVRPIKTMTATATAIADGDLSRRVPDVASGTEAGELGAALNRMLGHIEEAFDERSRSEARLRQFVGDASHELRTPVTTIRGYAELHRAGALDDPAELAEAMRRTEQEAVRMGTLIDDLLLLARLDQGRPLEEEDVDLSTLARDAARDASAVDPDRDITAATDGPLLVRGDEGRLRQVLANLVGNALVHTAPGTAVEVHARREGGRAVLEVVDHGPGMSEEVATKAFERFYRADPSRSRHRGGTGLGLAIVDATVGAHGGEVAIDTEPGRGTAVRVSLPLGGD